MSETKTQKTVVVGGGPVGALAALYAAQRGHVVEVYELRSDLRLPSTVPLNFTKSISLTLSERGIHAIKASGKLDLLDTIMSEALPMGSRMIHGKSASGEFYQQSQDYDIHGRANYATNRSGFNKVLLDELESLPNVKLFFSHKLTGTDIRRKKAWFEVSGAKEKVVGSRDKEIETTFDFIIGADGAHSATRYHLMKYTRMDYQQEYIDTLWCEFAIPAKDSSEDDPESRFAISPNHLHIWPGHEFMFIAIPNLDGSFTCTLFMPSTHFTSLESDPHSLPAFFDAHFPGVTALINPTALISSFIQNPHLPLISIKCRPHHFSDAAVIIGDAAHAMVPFYGQGMNAGLEDVRVLFSLLDKHISPTASHQSQIDQRAKALAEYSATRTEDAYAINDLSLQNYTEMRASVTAPTYRARKWLEEKLSVYVPSLGWQTKYSRVSFGNERYSEVIKKSEQQGRHLMVALIGVLASPVVIGAFLALQRWRASTRGAFKWQDLLRWKSL